MSFNPTVLLTLASIAAALGFMTAEYFSNQVGRWVCKSLASALFVAVGISAGGLHSPTGQLIVAGLVLGALGDVLLLPHGKLSFLLGLTSFLLGHIAYAVACYQQGFDRWFLAGLLVPLAAVAFVVSRWLLPKVERAMKGPVIAYMVVISAMVALGGAATRQNPGLWPWSLAAVAFYLSDLSVARDRFVKEEFLNRLWGLPLYFGAQLLFAGTAVLGNRG